MHLYNIFYIKTFKIAPTCFDLKINFMYVHYSDTSANEWPC